MWYLAPSASRSTRAVRFLPWCMALVLLWGIPVQAQPSPAPEAAAATSGPLYDELARLDSLIFDASFVSCDAEAIMRLFTDDIEFYHDLTGASYGDEVRDDFRRLTASCPRENGVTRELIAGSLEVYPMQDYGAVQRGVHRFTERGAATRTVAKFVHLWQRQADGTWKISRVLSFDHRPEPIPAPDGGG
ncbi:MAG: nuclear transport factor 2 family protein [Bacteroidota bacterium]